jgi:hypothetical protein
MVGYSIPRLAIGGDEILGDQKPGNVPGNGHPKRPSDWVAPRMGHGWNVSLSLLFSLRQEADGTREVVTRINITGDA